MNFSLHHLVVVTRINLYLTSFSFLNFSFLNVIKLYQGLIVTWFQAHNACWRAMLTFHICT